MKLYKKEDKDVMGSRVEAWCRGSFAHTLRQAQNASTLFKILLSASLIFFLSACGGKNTPADTQQQEANKDTTASTSNKKVILFFGDSLTAGYGLDDPSNAFPGVIERKIDSLQLPYAVTNAGVSGETTAGGLARIDWILKQRVDIFVLELGANDGLRGIPVTETTKNLQSIIDKVKPGTPKPK